MYTKMLMTMYVVICIHTNVHVYIYTVWTACVCPNSYVIALTPSMADLEIRTLKEDTEIK